MFVKIIKRFLSLVICAAMVLSLQSLDVRAATKVNGVNCTTMAALENTGNEDINAKWSEYYDKYDEATDSRPEIYTTFKETLPTITFNDNNTVDLAYPACPTLVSDWQCVGYSYSIVGVQGKKPVKIEDANIAASGDVTTGVTLHVTLPDSVVLTNGRVTFTYLVAPVETQATASITYENVFDGSDQSHGYNDWNDSIKRKADAILPTETEVNTDKTWTVPIPDRENLGAGTGGNEEWIVTAYEIQIDNGEWTTHAIDDRDINVPAGTKSIKVKFKWQLVSVSSVIEDLSKDRVVKQGDKVLQVKSGTKNVYVLGDNKENMSIGYIPTMDLKNLDSNRYSALTWEQLQKEYAKISDDTTVTLTFRFSDFVDLTQSGLFDGVQLQSDMFDLDSSSIKIDGQTVTMKCKWNSSKAQTAADKGSLSPIIKLVSASGSQIYLPIKSNWTGDAIEIVNEGHVTGDGYFLYGENNSRKQYFAIYGGFQSDTVFMGPGTQNDPPVKKTITGDTPSKAGTFEFTITPSNEDWPVPAQTTVKVTTKDHASAEFGNIFFTKTGDYVYTVREVKGSLEGYTYDDTVYTVTYHVTETNGVLSSTRTFTKDGEEYEADTMAFAFTNPYSAPGDDDDHHHHRHHTDDTPATPTTTVTQVAEAGEVVQPVEAVTEVAEISEAGDVAQISSTDAVITTGDDSRMELYLVLMLAAGAALAVWAGRRHVR